MGLWDRIKRAVSGQPEAPPPKRSPRQVFVDFFSAHARRHPVVERLEPDPKDELTLQVWVKGRDSPSTLYLGNLLEEIRELSPEQKVERIQRFLAVLENQDEELSWEEAQEVLVPLVRMQSFTFMSPAEPLAESFLPFVSLCAGLDRGESIRIVLSSEPKRWGVEPVEVFEAAFATLENHIEDSDLELFDPDADYPIWHVTRDDSYESSRLALPGFLAGLRHKVRGNPIAVVPARSLMVISGDGDLEAIARLARLAQTEFEASPRSISPAVYTAGANGAVEPLHLPPEHPHHHLVESGHRLLAAHCYADQKQTLEARFESEGVDVFVASLGLFSEKASGAVRSWAAMTEGVESLLPAADLIALGGGSKEQGDDWVAFVPWSVVFELCGHCFERDPRFDPARWRVCGWPDEGTIRELRARSIVSPGDSPGR